MKIIMLALIALVVCGCMYEPMDYEVLEDADMGGAIINKDGWSASGKLIGGNTSKSVSMQANFARDRGGPGSGLYTVQFFVGHEFTLAVTERRSTEAEITWSVEGNYVRRLVSVVNGMSVTGTGQAVKVVISDSSTSPTAQEYSVSCQVAPGARASIQQPPYLFRETLVELVNVGNTATIAVPDNAGIISVYVAAAVTGGAAGAVPGDLLVAQKRGASTVVTFDPVAPGGWVPLAPGVSALQFLNLNAPAQAEFSTFFGIDG